MASRFRYLREGLIAGFIGAALVAVWFLIYDAAHGRPFRTPFILGTAAFRGLSDPAATAVTPGVVVQYTVLHGVVFAMIGILLAFLVASAQDRPSRLLTLFIALLCFEVGFLALMTWMAPAVLGELAWWAILVANALAAGGMLVYFFAGPNALGRALLGAWTRPVREGAVAGLLGASAVALWFLAHDLVAGAPFRTPALLGAAVFEGLRDPGTLVVTAPLVLKYTLLHGAAFLAFGWLAAGLLALADREPRLLLGLLILFCCFEVFFLALVAVLAEWLFETLAWWTILVANALAAVVMLAYFFREHRLAWRELRSARPL